MYLDAQTMFSDDQDISQIAGTYISTNVVDLSAAGLDAGEPIHVWIQMTETLASAGAATLSIGVYTDSDEAFGTEVLLVGSATLALATCVAGYQCAINCLPRNTDQYVRLKYTIGTATTTAGTISAGLIVDNQAGEHVN